MPTLNEIRNTLVNYFTQSQSRMKYIQNKKTKYAFRGPDILITSQHTIRKDLTAIQNTIFLRKLDAIANLFNHTEYGCFMLGQHWSNATLKDPKEIFINLLDWKSYVKNTAILAIPNDSESTQPAYIKTFEFYEDDDFRINRKTGRFSIYKIKTKTIEHLPASMFIPSDLLFEMNNIF